MTEEADSSQPLTVFLLAALAAVGGFLFGYDTGVISGAMAVILEEDSGLLSGLGRSERDLWHQVIVAITIGAAAVFALLSGVPSQMLGRKVTILAASTIFAVGSVVMGVATSKELLLVGRFIVGAAVGLASTVVPVYISEAAPVHMRGSLTVSYNTLVVAGQFVATLTCGAFASVHEGWRWMLGLAGVPAAIQFVGFIFMPESPRWLMSRGREQEAAEILKRIRPRSYDTEAEIREIKEAVERDKSLETGTWDVIRRISSHQPTRRALLIGCSLQLFQQLSGINTIMYYSATVVQMAGIGSAGDAIWITAGINSLYLLACGIGIIGVERIGRRKLVLFSMIGVVTTLFIIGVAFVTMDGAHKLSSRGNDCPYAGKTCDSCLKEDCGFCFDKWADSAISGYCMRSNGSHGMCNGDNPSQYTWYPDYCPTSKVKSWTIIIALAAYLVSFAAGIAPVPWTVNAEIYPLWARAVCTSVATATNWSFNLIIAMTFLTLTDLLTRAGAFFLYGGLAALGASVFYLFLPETRGRSLEEMTLLFSGPLIVSRR